jgi:hypothetical protein
MAKGWKKAKRNDEPEEKPEEKPEEASAEESKEPDVKPEDKPKEEGPPRWIIAEGKPALSTKAGILDHETSTRIGGVTAETFPGGQSTLNFWVSKGVLVQK